jgi:hypothetical protein
MPCSQEIGMLPISMLDARTGVRLMSTYLVVLGLGLGAAMYVLVIAVQNAVDPAAPPGRHCSQLRTTLDVPHGCVGRGAARDFLRSAEEVAFVTSTSRSHKRRLSCRRYGVGWDLISSSSPPHVWCHGTVRAVRCEDPEGG